MAKKNKKAEGGMSFEVLIKLILGIVVLVGVFYFLFGNYIWDYVRNLPGNKYNDRDLPVGNISKNDVILSSYYRVGVILDGKYVKLCTNGDCNQLRDTKLYLNGDDRQGEIYTDINWAFDKKVGSILNSKLIINPDIFQGKGVYSSVKNELPSYADLRNLDGSLYITGTFYRDNEYIVAEDERVFGVKTIFMQSDNSSFGDILKTARVGDELIVMAEYEFETTNTGILVYTQTKVVSNSIKIVKTKDNELTFYAYYSLNGKEYYGDIDCNRNGWIGSTLDINNIQNTLSQTLEKNCNYKLK